MGVKTFLLTISKNPLLWLENPRTNYSRVLTYPVILTKFESKIGRKVKKFLYIQK